MQAAGKLRSLCVHCLFNCVWARLQATAATSENAASVILSVESGMSQVGRLAHTDQSVTIRRDNVHFHKTIMAIRLRPFLSINLLT